MVVAGDLTIDGYIYPTTSQGTINSVTLNNGSYFTLSRGIWVVSTRSDCNYGYYDRDSYSCLDSYQYSSVVFSSGSARCYYEGTDHNNGKSKTFYYRRIG